MNRWAFSCSLIFLLCAVSVQSLLTGAAESAKQEEAGAKTLAAASRALEALDENQRQKATFAYADKERFNWHFIPRERKGVALRELEPPQKTKIQDLLKASLSAAGYKRAEQVRELESVLAEIEGPDRRFSRDPELYFFSVFGKPGADETWGWRFEGHHLSLNFSLKGGQIVSATPLFLGANPALVRVGPLKGLRVLAKAEDIARELMVSLNKEQLAVALGKEEPIDVQGAEKARYEGPFPSGLTADRLRPDQKGILKRLIGDYLSDLPEARSQRLEKGINQAGLEKIHIAWRGTLKANQPHSYIVHGPTFVLSYANTQNDANHVHRALRELAGDFGGEG